ncbi:unnamed protein product, partial [marine sediment metagenome]
TPNSGQSTGEVDEVILTIDISGLSIGLHNCELTVISDGTVNSPQRVSINLYIDDGNGKLDVPSEFGSIQEAIDFATNGDVIIVAEGIYTGDGNRDIHFKGKALTVRSQNGPENCVIDCNGRETEPHRGFNFSNNLNTNAIIDGFTIINGYSDEGSGINCRDNQGSSLTISNCNIRNHTSLGDYGVGNGAISVRDGIYLIHNCLISNNSASGIYCGDTISTAITNCTITGNTIGGIFCRGDSNVEISNCTITANTFRDGGGIYCNGIISMTITNCTI